MPEPAAENPIACPVCGQRNDCALANPAAATLPCWCYSVSIDTQTMAQVAATENRSTCLCPACAQAAHAQHNNAS